MITPVCTLHLTASFNHENETAGGDGNDLLGQEVAVDYGASSCELCSTSLVRRRSIWQPSLWLYTIIMSSAIPVVRLYLNGVDPASTYRLCLFLLRLFWRLT